MCYKFDCSTIYDLSNESKAQFGQTMLGVITAQNFCAVFLIVLDLFMGFPKYLAITAVLICFVCTAIQIAHVKKEAQWVDIQIHHYYPTYLLVKVI